MARLLAMSWCRPRASLLTIALLACSPAGPTGAAAQSAPEQPPATGGRPAAGPAVAPEIAPGIAPAAAPGKPRAHLFDEAFVQGIYVQAVSALRDGAQIELLEPVPAVLLTAEEARARRAAYSRSLREDAGVTAAIDLAADFVFSESMLGRYLPDEKVLYIMEEVLESNSGGDRDVAREQLFGVMAHELVHAHDDQVYKTLPTPAVLLEVAADGKKLADIQALMTLLEGHATYAAELASLHTGRRPLEVMTVEQARRARVMSGGDDPLKQIGSDIMNTIARTKLVQYAYGREFCKDAYSFGGERFIGEVFTHLPLSIAETENFELFKQRWASEMEAAEEAGAVENAAAQVSGS